MVRVNVANVFGKFRPRAKEAKILPVQLSVQKTQFSIFECCSINIGLSLTTKYIKDNNFICISSDMDNKTKSAATATEVSDNDENFLLQINLFSKVLKQEKHQMVENLLYRRNSKELSVSSEDF